MDEPTSLSATVPLRRGPMANALAYEVAREVVNQAIARLMLEWSTLEAAQAPPALIAPVREQALALTRRLRALAVDDVQGLQALATESAKARRGTA